MLKGIAASQGVAIGKALVIEEIKPEIKKIELEATEVSTELERFRQAVEVSRQQLEKIKQAAERKLGTDKAEIFGAHLLMLEDPEFTGSVEQKISGENVNAEYALKEVTEMFVSIFDSMDNEYMKERAADVKDVSGRLVNNLLGIGDTSLLNLDCERIVVARDLTPSDTAQMDKNYVIGFAVEVGGRTSHSAIMARTMEIPAVVGLGSIKGIKNEDMLILDGSNGVLIINPDEAVLQEYEHRKLEEQKSKKELEALRDLETVTRDGRKILLAANIGSPNHTEGVLRNGAEGIGLFRTEFLYMESDAAPDEEQQFNAYKAVLQDMGNRPVIIRTLDIGGDKQLAYLNIGAEANPFLGYRAIRLCLDRRDLFKTQLRALYRASVYGNLKIMFPMISSLQELRQAKSAVEEVKAGLEAEHIAYGAVEIGIMIEIPSAAVISDVLAKEVDFFSIGTNDLIQYTVAVDRMNERIAYLYDPFHPAVLRLIKLVIDNAHKAGKHVGMCGEMAGDRAIIPVLLGMGLDEFSMSASGILSARKLIRGLDFEYAEKLAGEVLQLGSSDDIRRYLVP